MRRRAVAAAAVALLAWSAQDVLAWGLFVEHRHLDHDVDLGNVYQQLHQAVLLALIVAGVLWLARHRWLAAWFAGATWTLAYSGLCDLLYYWLAGRGLPGTFPWLDGSGHILVLFHPATGAALAASALTWLTLWAAALAASGIPPLLLRLRQLDEHAIALPRRRSAVAGDHGSHES